MHPLNVTADNARFPQRNGAGELYIQLRLRYGLVICVYGLAVPLLGHASRALNPMTSRLVHLLPAHILQRPPEDMASRHDAA